MNNSSDDLPLAKFLRLETATDQEIAARWAAGRGIFGVEPGMRAADLKALGIPKSVNGPYQKLKVKLTGDVVTEVEYAYLGGYDVGEALATTLSERFGAAKGSGTRWDTEVGRFVLKRTYRGGPGYWDVTVRLSAPAPTKATKKATPTALDTPESLGAALTSYLHDVEGDVFDAGSIDRVVVSPQGTDWHVEVLARGGGSASFDWSEPARGEDGSLAPELVEALVDAGGRAIDV